MHLNNLKLKLFQSLDKLFTNFTRKKNSVPFTSSGTLNHVRIDEKDKSDLNCSKSYISLFLCESIAIVFTALGNLRFQSRNKTSMTA